MLVSQILSTKPSPNILFVSPTATISNATEVLSANRVGALLVFDEQDALKGVVSERDIVREIGRRGAAALDLKVSDIMTEAVVSCAAGDTAVSVLEKMTSGRFRHMPVMDAAKVVGVISIGDVVKARIDEVEHENSALTEMIAGHA